MEHVNFKSLLDESEIEAIREILLSVFDSSTVLHREEFTAEDVQETINQLDWASKILFSILIMNDGLSCDHDHDDD